jgi:hypothetical protein
MRELASKTREFPACGGSASPAADTGTFKQSWHFPDATPGDLNTGGVYAGRKVSGREQLIIQL